MWFSKGGKEEWIVGTKKIRKAKHDLLRNPFTKGCAWAWVHFWKRIKMRPAWLLVLAGVVGCVAYVKGKEHVSDIFAFICVEGFLHHSIGFLSEGE